MLQPWGANELPWAFISVKLCHLTQELPVLWCKCTAHADCRPVADHREATNSNTSHGWQCCCTADVMCMCLGCCKCSLFVYAGLLLICLCLCCCKPCKFANRHRQLLGQHACATFASHCASWPRTLCRHFTAKACQISIGCVPGHTAASSAALFYSAETMC